MRSTAGIAAFLLTAAQAQKVVQFDIRGTPQNEKRTISKRATVGAYLLNDMSQYTYTINASIGTPPQQVNLQLDTGSTDIWVNYAGSNYCRARNCFDSYDPRNSSSYAESVPNGFEVAYGDGSGASGDYITDTININGVSITNQTIGLALKSDIQYGLMGVGFRGTEGSCGEGGSAAAQQSSTYCYPTIIDNMLDQKKINSRAFSLYLNDLGQSTGSILFGGVDTSKFVGGLTQIPMAGIQYTDGTIETDRYTVAWTNLTITTPNGVQNIWDQLYQAGSAYPVLIDSGTSTARFPPDITQALYKQMGAVVVKGEAYAPCYLRTANVTIDFHLGGSDGAIVKVPIDEFLYDLDSTYNKIWARLGGTQYCSVAFSAADDGLPIFGDTVMRTSYYVYDLDNRVIALGPANFSPGKATVKEITNGTIPGVTKTASKVSGFSSFSSAASSAPPRGYNTGSGLMTASITTQTNVPLAQFTTAKYTGQNGYSGMANYITTAAASSATGGSTSKGAASGVNVPKARMDSLIVLALVSCFVAVGAGMVLL